MGKQHKFQLQTTWTGNAGQGTADYRAYKRDHEISGDGKQAPIPGSSDPVFRGDGSRYNPEELLVGSISACHMLWMLHLCADAGIVVTEYSDAASGMMAEEPDGGGRFTEVTLHPRITITDETRIAEVEALHAKAHELCFIARSVNFPVHHSAVTVARR
ncbi:MAG TPA: OsmC family protein [Bryobacteraceae bacterium]|nr:OsmC family protein [Bryobacteraceae bacterium]